MYYVFEPIVLSNDNVFAYECLTRQKKPLGDGHDYYENLFKNATPEFLLSLAEEQLRFLIKNYFFFSEKGVRVNINVDISTLTVLTQSVWKKRLDDYPLINIEIDLARNFPVKGNIHAVLNLFKGRLWLDDVSPENIRFAGSLLRDFSFVKVDKVVFWNAQRNSEQAHSLAFFRQCMHSQNINTVAEGIDCTEKRRASETLGLFAGQGYHWPAVSATEIENYCLSRKPVSGFDESTIGSGHTES